MAVILKFRLRRRHPHCHDALMFTLGALAVLAIQFSH